MFQRKNHIQNHLPIATKAFNGRFCFVNLCPSIPFWKTKITSWLQSQISIFNLIENHVYIYIYVLNNTKQWITYQSFKYPLIKLDEIHCSKLWITYLIWCCSLPEFIIVLAFFVVRSWNVEMVFKTKGLGFGKVATNIQRKKTSITMLGKSSSNTRPFKINVSASTSAQNPGWLFCMEDYTILPSYAGDYNKPLQGSRH